jgi:hypothetical protein
MDAREVEMKWMVRCILQEPTSFYPFSSDLFTARVNWVLFYLLWTSVTMDLIYFSHTWGEAYETNGTDSTPRIHAFQSIVTPEYEIPMTGHQMYHHQHSNNVYQKLPRAISVFGSWPPASEHPLFYISIYAAIGLASALCSVLSVTAQYTGALRASRILFTCVLALFTCKTLPTRFFSFPFRQLVTVVRATFRFHDTTPQGALDASTTANQSPFTSIA